MAEDDRRVAEAARRALQRARKLWLELRAPRRHGLPSLVAYDICVGSSVLYIILALWCYYVLYFIYLNIYLCKKITI